MRLNAKPSIRIEAGSFVVRYDEEDYVIGAVQIGLELAVRKALIIKQEDRSWRSRDEATEPAIQEFFRIRERLQIDPL